MGSTGGVTLRPRLPTSAVYYPADATEMATAGWRHLSIAHMHHDLGKNRNAHSYTKGRGRPLLRMWFWLTILELPRLSQPPSCSKCNKSSLHEIYMRHTRVYAHTWTTHYMPTRHLRFTSIYEPQLTQQVAIVYHNFDICHVRYVYFTSTISQTLRCYSNPVFSRNCTSLALSSPPSSIYNSTNAMLR